MQRIQNSPLILTCLALCAVISVAYAATPELSTKSNSYYLYTQALNTTDSGVVAVPSRFKWSIETSWSGTAEIRSEIEQKYGDEWNKSGFMKRWFLKRRMNREIATLVTERSKHISPDAWY